MVGWNPKGEGLSHERYWRNRTRARQLEKARYAAGRDGAPTLRADLRLDRDEPRPLARRRAREAGGPGAELPGAAPERRRGLRQPPPPRDPAGSRGSPRRARAHLPRALRAG